jgi:hypothetical protein
MARGGDGRQHLGIDRGRRRRGGHRHRHRRQRPHARPKPGRQHLLELGQRAQRRLLDPADRVADRGSQPDDHGDRLGVVEQERRHRGSGAEPVSPRGPARTMHRVAEVPQSLDVVTYRPRGHAEPFCQFAAGPIARRLQQGQQAKQPGRSLHTGTLAS